MNITERDRLAGALVALRPDWANGGVDRIKRVRTWLNENAMDWAYLDAVICMTVCALDPKTDTPARSLTDGPWRTVLRHATHTGSEQPLTIEARGADCALCGRPRGQHGGLSIRIGLDGQSIDEHDWTPAAELTPADKTSISRAREVAFAHRTETNA